MYQIDGGTPDCVNRVVTYTASGVSAIDGWYIHLLVEPVYGGNSGASADEGVHLFYDGEMEDALVSSNRLSYVDGCIQLLGAEPQSLFPLWEQVQSP